MLKENFVRFVVKFGVMLRDCFELSDGFEQIEGMMPNQVKVKDQEIH